MDFLVVGAGFFGTVFAERMANSGRKVLLIEKRDHIGGNCFSKLDDKTGIEIHKYGSHIFHTSNELVWSYINKFTKFNEYRHTVWSNYKNMVYPMPINLATINNFYRINLRPDEVVGFIQNEIRREAITNPKNLEEQAISLIGRPLYEAFIKGYTIKHWDKDPRELSPEIIKRLPFRNNYNNRYFSDKYEGIPLDGYTKIFDRMLDNKNICVRLNTDYFKVKNEFKGIPTLYTGPIDRFFDYQFGRLDWRTVYFEKNYLDVEDYQGCSVMNYADSEIPFTRIHEFKHFHPERKREKNTIIFKEFSKIAHETDDPYYPVNTPRNQELLKKYHQLLEGVKNVWLGGRLGYYKYLDMHETISAALNLVDKITGSTLFPN